MIANEPLDLRKILLRSVSGGTLIYLAGALLGLLVGIQLARGLGVNGYGTYGSALAVATLGASVASGGVQLLGTRDTAALRARGDISGVRRLLVWAFRHVLLLSIPVSAIAGLALWGLMAFDPLTAVTGGALVWLLAFLAVFGGFLRGLDAVILGMALDAAIRPAVYSVLLFFVAALALPLSPTSALLLTGVAIAAALAFGLPQIVAVLRAPSGPVGVGEENRWYSATMTMRTTTILRMVEATAPLILVGSLVNMAEAGAFRVATTITALGGMVGSVIHLALPALFAQLHATGEADRMRRLAAVSTLIMAVPALALLLLSLEFGSSAIGVVFGTEFAPAAVPTSILLASTVIVAVGGVSSVLLQTHHGEKLVNRAYGVSLVVTILLTLALAPAFGAIGAAIGVATGTLTRIVTMSFLCQRKTGIDPSVIGALLVLRGVIGKTRRN